MAKKFVAPDLSNATPTSILDEMGALSIMENQIKKLRAFYKEAYYARVGIKASKDGIFLETEDKGTISFPEVDGFIKEGETFTATTTRSHPERISTELLKEKYPTQAFECTIQGDQLTTRFTLREGVVNPVVNDLLEQMKKELDLD